MALGGTQITFPSTLPQCGTATLRVSGVTYPARVEFYYQPVVNGPWEGSGEIADIYSDTYTYTPTIPSGYILWVTVTDNTGRYLQNSGGCTITASTDSACLTDLSSSASVSTSTVLLTTTQTETQTQLETQLETQTETTTATETAQVTSFQSLGQSLASTVTITETLSPSHTHRNLSANPTGLTPASPDDLNDQLQLIQAQLGSSQDKTRILGGVLGALLALSLILNLFFCVGLRNRKKRSGMSPSPHMQRFMHAGDDSHSFAESLVASQDDLAAGGQHPEFVVSRSPTMRSTLLGSNAAISPAPVSDLILRQGMNRQDTSNSIDTITSHDGTLRNVYLTQPGRGLYATNASSRLSLSPSVSNT